MDKIVFFSSTQFGAGILATLLNSKYEVVAVVTRSDKVRGRGNKVVSTPVKSLALEHDIDVLEYDKVGEAEAEILKKYNADFFLVVAYGCILPQIILDIPKVDSINIHASLLPHLRGASPIETAIKLGDKNTGISYIKMIKSLDAGDIYIKHELEINCGETFDSLNAKLLDLSKKTVVDALDAIKDGLVPRPQGEEYSYAEKITKESCEIDFENDAIDIVNHINSLDSHIGAYAFKDDERYKLFGASLGNLKLNIGEVDTTNGIEIGAKNGSVKLARIQAPGKKIMNVEDFLRGNKLEGSFAKKKQQENK